MGFFHTAPPQTNPSAATFSSAANGSNSNKKKQKKNRAHTKSLFREPQTKANSGKSLAYKFPINFSCKNQAHSHSHTWAHTQVLI